MELTDSTGYNCLHWAVISSHYEIAKLLLERGVSIIQDPSGKTPLEWANERHQKSIYQKILHESHRSPRMFTLSNSLYGMIMYLIPFIALPTYIWILSTFQFGIALLLIIPSAFALSFLIQKLLSDGDMDKILKSPFMSAIPQATILFTFATWISILPCIYIIFLNSNSIRMIDSLENYMLNITYFIFNGICVYSLYKAVNTDPGFLPFHSETSQKQEVNLIFLYHSICFRLF